MYIPGLLSARVHSSRDRPQVFSLGFTRVQYLEINETTITFQPQTRTNISDMASTHTLMALKMASNTNTSSSKKTAEPEEN